jgi:hypothetical protein
MKNQELKKAYGIENVYFYIKNKKFHCCYGSKDDEIDLIDLDFILKSLSIQQGVVFFDDVGEECVGMDQLKYKYLILKLSGL